MTGTGKRFVAFFHVVMSFFLVSGRRIALAGIGRQHAAFCSRHAPVALGHVGGCTYAFHMPRHSIGTPSFSFFATKGDSTIDKDEYDWDTILPFEKNHHNSVKVIVPDEKGENDVFDLTNFYSKLEATVATAQQLHKSALWLEIPISRASLI